MAHIGQLTDACIPATRPPKPSSGSLQPLYTQMCTNTQIIKIHQKVTSL